MYSIVKRIVNIHSAALRSAPYRVATLSTLSAMTAATLSRIALITTTSKILPACVSDSKTTRKSARRQPRAGFPKEIASDTTTESRVTVAGFLDWVIAAPLDTSRPARGRIASSDEYLRVQDTAQRGVGSRSRARRVFRIR